MLGARRNARGIDVGTRTRRQIEHAVPCPMPLLCRFAGALLTGAGTASSVAGAADDDGTCTAEGVAGAAGGEATLVARWSSGLPAAVLSSPSVTAMTPHPQLRENTAKSGRFLTQAQRAAHASQPDKSNLHVMPDLGGPRDNCLQSGQRRNLSF